MTATLGRPASIVSHIDQTKIKELVQTGCHACIDATTISINAGLKTVVATQNCNGFGPLAYVIIDPLTNKSNESSKTLADKSLDSSWERICSATAWIFGYKSTE